jgi:hypothetical protein
VSTRTLDQLRRGARIHSLVYASFIARNTDRQYDVVWEGLGYRRTSKDGATGIVVFSKSGAVGAFFEPSSPRSPKTTKKKPPLAEMTKGIPSALANVAKREAFPAMSLDTDDPMVTAVFWSDSKGELVGARPWPKLDEDGAHLVSAETCKPEACIEQLAKLYGIDDARVKVVSELFASKAALAEPANGRVTLSSAGRETLGLLPNQVTRELLQGAGIDLA